MVWQFSYLAEFYVNKVKMEDFLLSVNVETIHKFVRRISFAHGTRAINNRGSELLHKNCMICSNSLYGTSYLPINNQDFVFLRKNFIKNGFSMNL